jgi:hypothetical protein
VVWTPAVANLVPHAQTTGIPALQAAP